MSEQTVLWVGSFPYALFNLMAQAHAGHLPKVFVLSDLFVHILPMGLQMSLQIWQLVQDGSIGLEYVFQF